MNALSITRLIKVLSAVSLLAVLGACQSMPKASSKLKDGASFSTYQTFALSDARPGPVTDPALAIRLGAMMRRHLATSLEARGLRQAPAGQADLIIDLAGSVSTEVYFNPVYLPPGYRLSRWYPAVPVRYLNATATDVVETGTLVVFAIDRAKNEPVWAGWVQGTYDANVKEETVKQAIDAILAQLPAKS
jgi:hypothetical protein